MLLGTDKIESLKQTLSDGLKRVPNWKAGEFLLAIIDSRSGNTDEAVKRLERL